MLFRAADSFPRGRSEPRGVFYGWTIVFVCFLSLMLAFGSRYSFGVFLPPLMQEFGWSRSQLSLSFAILTLVFGLGQPVVGILLERYDSRIILSVGAVLMAGGTLGTIYATRIWHVHILIGLITGVGFSALGVIPTAVLISRWFMKLKGTALGVSNAGVSIGQLIFAPLSMWLVLAIGWRTAFFVTGILFLVPLLPLVLLLLRNRPSDLGLLPDGAAPAGGPQPEGSRTGAPVAAAARDVREAEERVPPRVALRTMSYWLLAGPFIICGATVNLVNLHFVVMTLDWGIAPMVAANALGLVGAVNAVGILIAGNLSDRFGRKIPLAGVYMFRVLAFLILMFNHSVAAVYVFAVLYGLTSFSAAPLTSALVGDVFGIRSVGSLLGLISMGHQIGGALGSYLAAVVFEITGSYQLVLLAGVVLLTANIAATLLVPERRRVQARIPAQA